MIPDPITVEEDRVILRGELAESVIFDGLEWSDSEHVEAYRALFEGVGKFPGDPSESYYQGMTFTRVIRRKSDNRNRSRRRNPRNRTPEAAPDHFGSAPGLSEANHRRRETRRGFVEAETLPPQNRPSRHRSGFAVRETRRGQILVSLS